MAKEHYYNGLLMILFYFWYGGGHVDTMAAPFYYLLMLYFETIVENAMVCNIFLFLLDPCFGMVWVVVGHLLYLSKHGVIYY